MLLGALIVAGASAICYGVFGVNSTTAGFVYLVIILVLAAAWELPETLFSSAVALLCFVYYFLPPFEKFAVSGPENWVALGAFLTTALVASQLSAKARKQTQEVDRRRQESEMLYSLSRAILVTESVGTQTAQSLAQILKCRSVALYDADREEVFEEGEAFDPDVIARLKTAAQMGLTTALPEADLLIAPVKLGSRSIGALALKGCALSENGIESLLNLVAISLERVRTQEAANRAAAAQQSEEFKSTLLDAITHEFKTPLTSIKAASTSILTDAVEVSPQVRELTSIIDEEATRLNLLVTDAVRMAQMDASKIQLERRPVAVREFVAHVLEGFGPRLEERSLTLNLRDDLPGVSADPDLASLALRQVIDNSLKYSPPATPLQVAADAGTTGITIRVTDQGPGIPEQDRARIFERFYRRPSSKNGVPGSGLGLYIAREIVRAHGGDLWVESAAGTGSEFCLRLPRQKEAPLL